MGTIVLAFFLTMYVLPAIIASIRKTSHHDAICVINILLGWTVIGYVVALLWAITEKEAPPAEQIAATKAPEPKALAPITYKADWTYEDRKF